jgi:hypothetical protein
MGIQDSSSQTPLHIAAENHDCPDSLLKLLITRSTSEILNQKKGDGQTAFGFWLQRKTCICQTDMFQLFLQKDVDLELDQKDVSDKHPLTLLVSRSRKEVITLMTMLDDWARANWNTDKRSCFIELTLKASKKGKRPLANVAKVLLKSVEDFNLIKDATLLAAVSAKIGVIGCQRDPILTLMKIGQLCHARSNTAQEELSQICLCNPTVNTRSAAVLVEEIQVLEALSNRLEKFACNLLSNFPPVVSANGRAAVGEVLTKGSVRMALTNKWDKLVLNDRFWDLAQEWWYGEMCIKRTSSWKLIKQAMCYFLQAVLLPFMLMSVLFRHGLDYDLCLNHLWFLPSDCPCAFYMSKALGYICFVAILIIHVASGGATTSSITALEWIIIVYVIALAVEKIHEGTVFSASDFWCSWKNYADMLMLMLFIAYFSCRFIGQEENFGTNLKTTRIANHFLGFATLISILRILPYLVVHSYIGPMELSFVKMAPNVLLFFVVPGVFLVAFSVASKSVYEAGYYTAEFQGKMPSSHASLLDCMCDFLWVMLGLLDDIESFSTVSEAETSVVKTLVSLWQVISVLILLTMLIALVNYAFDVVQAQRVELFRLTVVSKIYILEAKKWPMPMPFNLIVLLLRIVLLLTCCCTKGKIQTGPKNHSTKEINPVAVRDMVKGYVAYKCQQQMKKGLNAVIGHGPRGQSLSKPTIRQSGKKSPTGDAMPRPVLTKKQDGGSQSSSFGSFSSQWSVSTNTSGMNMRSATVVQRPNTSNYTYASESECEDDLGEESGSDNNDNASDCTPLLTMIHQRKRRRLLSNLDRTDGYEVILEDPEALEACDDEVIS